MKEVLVYGMTDNPGGIESYLHSVFARVQDKLVHMDFVSDFPSISGAEKLTENGAKLYFIPAKGKGLFAQWKAFWNILHRHPEYKTVYFNVLDAGCALTALVPFLLGRKIVVHSHNSSTDKIRLHKLCRPILKIMARGRVACSKDAAEYMFGTAENVLLIPNSIDTRKYAFSPSARAEKRAELQLSPDRPVLCHVGRISEQKNPFGLIDIFEAVHQKCPQAVLLSVGDGELKDEFHAYIEKKNLKDAVLCLGIRHDIPQLLSCADVFLLPSFYEGLPISLVEAQASGIPCVISTAIPAQSILTNVVQAISLEESPAAWAEEILKLISSPRQDTFDQLVKAGFDISCCAQTDQKLTALF